MVRKTPHEYYAYASLQDEIFVLYPCPVIFCNPGLALFPHLRDKHFVQLPLFPDFEREAYMGQHPSDFWG